MATDTKTGAGRQRKSQPGEAETPPEQAAEQPPEQAAEQPEPEQPEPEKTPLPESKWPIPPGGGSYDLDVFTGELTLRAEPPPLKETEE